MKFALLISTYNWPSALDKVLQSVQNQTLMPNEILIADDGSKEETKTLIEDWKQKSKIPIKHFWQEDDGFRKTIIMNKAVAGTDADYIIQIDGDIILDKNFIKDHISEKEKGFFLNGSRALISEENTHKILAEKELRMDWVSKNVKNKINATRFPFMANFFRKDHFKSNNVKGCNFSFWREDFVAVNGYNNDMSGWGHEDIELAARLNNLGIKQRRLKMRAICYHLHHDYFDRKDELSNFSVYDVVVENKVIQSKNGYNEVL
ncbi:glycosyltransferase family 2 protein [Soonwooa sp.]|uniref:glycosyltransferase family 2 protein n=1 Tax=Soonwooa sp. TaxID=1938592 RepID=UPI0028B1CFC8|nr:glycosyltransferase family 2 protein [Soonwooa sp.]